MHPIERDIALGSEAERIWNDPITKDLVDGIRKRYMDVILKSEINDTATRENAFRMTRALDDLGQEFAAKISRGQRMKSELKRRQ